MLSEKELEEQYGDDNWEGDAFLEGMQAADRNEDPIQRKKDSLFPDDLEDLPEEKFKDKFPDDFE